MCERESEYMCGMGGSFFSPSQEEPQEALSGA